MYLLTNHNTLLLPGHFTLHLFLRLTLMWQGTASQTSQKLKLLKHLVLVKAKPLSRFHQISQRSPFTNIVRFQLKRHRVLSEFPKGKRLLKKKSPTIVLGTLMEMEMEIGRRLWNLRTAFIVRVAMNLKKLQQLVDNILEGRSVTSRKFHMKRMYVMMARKKKTMSLQKPCLMGET